MSDIESEGEEILEEEDDEKSDDEEETELTIKEQVAGIEKSIIRTKKIIEVPKNERVTSNYITKTELVEIIGTRAALIEKGAPAYTQIGDLKNPIDIAVKEMLEGENPQKIQRVVRETETEKVVEIWSTREMIANLENYDEIVPENIFQKIQNSMISEFTSSSNSNFSNSETQNITTPNNTKTKKGGNETTTVPPISYWYNGTKKEKYMYETDFSKLDIPDFSDFSDFSDFPKTNGSDELEKQETFVTLAKRSEYEKMLVPNFSNFSNFSNSSNSNSSNNFKKIEYVDIDNKYSEITRMLAMIAAKGDDEVIVDINLVQENSLLQCVIQVLKYYYKTVVFGVLPYKNSKSSKTTNNDGKTKKIRILAKDKNNVHPFYTQSLVNLIDLPEVKSIFLVSDLIVI